MAYNFQDIDPENIDFKQQSDDARKKRLAAMAAIITGGATGGNFTDMLGQYATERVGQAADKLGQAGEMIQNPESAVQQRLGVQPEVQPVGPVMPQEVAQQRQPEVLPQQTMQAQQMPQVPVQPQPIEQPVQQVQAQPKAQETVSPVNPEQVTLPQAGPGVQVAGTQPGAGLQQTQPAQQPMPSQTPDWHDKLVNADFNGLSSLLTDPSIPKDVKNEAQDRMYNMLNDRRLEATANQTIEKAVAGDPRSVSDLTRELTKKSTEGSMLKAMLYSRLGLTELAKDEQQKLGAGTRYEATVGPNNTRALIKYGADNMPISGFDEQGKLLSQESLAAFAANAMPTKAHLMPSVHGSPVVNSKGEIGTLMYDPRSQANYVQVGNERRPTTGWTTMAQNVQNVYNQAQAGALGKGAGEGFNPTPMKPLPGAIPQVQAPTTPAAVGTTPTTVATPEERVQGDIAGLQREIANTPNIPANQGRLQILRQELANARQQAQATGQQPTVPGAGVAQQKANLAIQEARIKEEQKPAAEAKGKETAASIKKQAFADNAYPIVKELGAIIKESTGSGLGASVDSLAAQIGASPKGAQAIAKLETFASPLVSMVPRFEGSQSDRDVQMYQKQAGDFANPKLPIATRLAALQGMVKLLQIYDKEGANDWAGLQGHQEKVINGVTYVYDGKGWKKK